MHLQGPELLDYIAHRTSAGWVTAPMMAPAGVLADVTDRDISTTLETTLAFGKPGENVEAASQLSSEAEFQIHDTALPDTKESWLLGGMALHYPNGQPIQLSYVGASPDLCHLFFFLGGFPPEALLPEGNAAIQLAGQLYEVDNGCEGGEPVLRLVGVDNHDGPHEEPALLDRHCTAGLGTGEGVGDVIANKYDAVAGGGTDVFFAENCHEGAGPEHQLFVRLAGARTVEVSKPVGETCSEVPCPGAGDRGASTFAGASQDGSRVFFTAPLLSGQPPLVPGDLDSSPNLYMASIGCPEGEAQCAAGEAGVRSLAELSHDTGGPAEVQGVVQVAPDGSHVYFVARGVLAGANAEGHSPVRGADNLYVYENDAHHPEGRVAFIAQLCSGRELSGIESDPSCPNGTRRDEGLWANEGAESQTAGEDGRFLVFTTFAQLAPGDVDNASDVYRYDAETETLERVSIGENGGGANGNCYDQPGENNCDATILAGEKGSRLVYKVYDLNGRAVSEDGSRIVFTSTAGLSEDATNGLANAYEWRETPGGGKVSLVSTGIAGEPVTDTVISPSGQDVFFITAQGLVPQDTDGVADVYDARLESETGFSVPPAEAEECSGDGCQGPLATPAPLLVPGSVVQAPGGNLPTKTSAPAKRETKPSCAKGRQRRHGACVKKRKARHRSKARRLGKRNAARAKRQGGKGR